MKRCTITTLTIALVSLVIMLIATHVAQSMAAKEGFAGGPGMGGHGMGGPGMGGPGMGGPGGRRPIVINVNNTGGAYAPQGAMEQQLAPKSLQITHELSEDSEEKLTKTMNFMEFVVKKSQN
jgi:hypothetical protein